MKKLILLFAVLTTMFCADTSYAELTKADIKEFTAIMKEYLDPRFDAINTKFDAINTKFDAKFDAIKTEINAVEKNLAQLREDTNKQFDRIDSQFNRLSAIFTAIVVCVIGFALWDRRTMIRPFETEIKKIEKEIGKNRTKLHSLLDALRSLSKDDAKVAEVLKNFHLL